jgi:hypothetical protein
VRIRGGIVSVRTTHQERATLKEQARAQGFDNLSDFVRHKLGLAKGIEYTAEIPGMNDLEDFSAVARNQAELLNRFDNLARDIGGIRRHLAVPDPSPTAFDHRPQQQPVTNGEFQR